MGNSSSNAASNRQHIASSPSFVLQRKAGADEKYKRLSRWNDDEAENEDGHELASRPIQWGDASSVAAHSRINLLENVRDMSPPGGLPSFPLGPCGGVVLGAEDGAELMSSPIESPCGARLRARNHACLQVPGRHVLEPSLQTKFWRSQTVLAPLMGRRAAS